MNHCLRLQLIIWLLYSGGWGLALGLYAIPSIINYTSDACVIDQCSTSTCTGESCHRFGKVTICTPYTYTCSQVQVHLVDGDPTIEYGIEVNGDWYGTKCYFEKERVSDTISFDYQVSVGEFVQSLLAGQGGWR